MDQKFKSIITLAFISSTILIVILCYTISKRDEVGVSGSINLPIVNSVVDIENFIKEKGYAIISTKGKVDTYKLEKKMLIGFPYEVIWGLQEVEPENYIGKNIDVYKFIVQNHVLDSKIHNSTHQTNIFIMVCDFKLIGGYSRPNHEGKTIAELPIGPETYSIDGKPIEEVKNMSFQNWREKWEKRYK